MYTLIGKSLTESRRLSLFSLRLLPMARQLILRQEDSGRRKESASEDKLRRGRAESKVEAFTIVIATTTTAAAAAALAALVK